MVTLTFANGLPNESLEIGDIAYYVSNINTNYENSGFITGDGNTGVSTHILIGTVSSIQINNSPDQLNTTNTLTQNTFTIFVEEPTTGIIAPTAGDFVFFIKDNIINTSSIPGYYNKVVFKNDSPFKAEMFATSCEIVESSK